MRSTEERLAAVRQRVWEIEAARNKRRSYIIGVSALAACLLIIVALSFFIPSVMSSTSAVDYSMPGTTASIFDACSHLGCILIGVLAFALGVTVTIFFYRIKVRNKEGQGDNDGRAS